MEKNLTTGSVWKTVLRFSLPFLMSYFLQTLYGMADLYIIGQFCGVESTTAVSIGSQVMHMLTVMIVGLAMGSVVTIGQAVGAADRRRISGAVGNTVTLFMTVSAVLTAVLFLLAAPITDLMSTPESAVHGTVDYLRICFLGIPFITAYNVISSIFRGMGDSRSPMYFIAAACVVNIGLDYLFIGLMQMGPAGAALGTTLSQTFSVCIALLVIRRQKGKLQLKRADFHPDRENMGGILRIGIPVAMQDGFIQIAFLIVTVFANLRGVEDAAAVGIVEKVIGILFLVPSSMLQTVSALAAQNVGVGKEDRARKTLLCGCILTLIWGSAAVIAMRFHAQEVIGLFSDHPETVRMGVEYMLGYVWDCVFAGVHFCFSGFFCAYGLSGLSFFHNAVSIVCVRSPFSYLAATRFPSTLLPMGMASTSGSVLSVLICLAAYTGLRLRQKKQA